MGANFTLENSKRISELLAAEKSTFEKDHYRLKISNAEEKRILVLEIYPEVDLGKTRGRVEWSWWIKGSCQHDGLLVATSHARTHH